ERLLGPWGMFVQCRFRITITDETNTPPWPGPADPCRAACGGACPPCLLPFARFCGQAVSNWGGASMSVSVTGLRCLVEIADAGLNVSAAAQAMHLSQPSVSRQLAQIEDVL